MPSSRFRAHRLGVLLVLACSLTPAETEMVFNPGKANLDIRFANSSTEVVDYLTAHPVTTTWW